MTGDVTDGQGRTVDFSNTLIIMTSNLGASHLAALDDSETVDKGVSGGSRRGTWFLPSGIYQPP